MFAVHKEAVVAERLYLKIIVKRCKPSQLGGALSVGHQAEYLACLAGRADDDPLSELRNKAFRDDRIALKVLQVAFSDNFIEITDTRLRPRQQDYVLRFISPLLRGFAPEREYVAVQVAQRPDAALVSEPVPSR
jgi:hypothetical protein